FFSTFTAMAKGNCFNKEYYIHVIFEIVYLLTALIASVGNGFMLYVVKRDPLKLFNKPTNVVNISIAINHLLAGLIVLPLIGVNSILRSQGLTNEVTKLFQDVLINYVVSNGSALLLILFLERYTAFVFPLLNRHYVTIKRVKRVSTSVTITCLLFSCILFTGVPQNVFYFVFIPLFILIPCLVMMFVLVAGFCGLKRRAEVAPGNKTEHSIRHNKKRRNLQLYKYLVAATRGTVLTVLPLVFYCVVKFLGLNEVEFISIPCYDLLEHLSFVILFVPAAANAFMIFWKIPVYSRSARHIWQRRKKVAV
ncbi:hypothetical protein ACROYT_G043077, partial [Oculina patagonica]